MKILLFIIFIFIVAVLIWSLSKSNSVDINQNIENANNIIFDPDKIYEGYKSQKINDCVKNCSKLFCEEESGKTICFDTVGLNECADACGWKE